MTPPCASLTVPDTEPVVTWADAGIAIPRSATKVRAQTLRIILMAPSFLSFNIYFLRLAVLLDVRATPNSSVLDQA